MITLPEILRAILVPAIIAALITGIGRWRRWAWPLPLAAGVGFLTGYVLLAGVPRLPPRDGTDWLFWAAIPVTALGIIDVLLDRRWGWILGAMAGVVATLIVWPLVPRGVSTGEAIALGIGLAIIAAALCYVAGLVDPRVGAFTIVAALCMTVGAAAIVVFSSNLRTVGMYGLAASAALGPIALLAGNLRAGRAVAIVAIPILAGLLVGGRYYPEPGVTWAQFAILAFTPALLLVSLAIPGQRRWPRAVGTLALVMIVLAWVTVPTVLEAKKAAEENPYEEYY